MIAQVMEYCNNHFVLNGYGEYKSYEIVSDGIVGNFTQTYIAGMYIWIRDSILNDGVYKIQSVTSNKITVEETLQEENTGRSIELYGLNPPTDFIALVNDIDSWVTSNSGKEGIASETIDAYSISWGSIDGNTANTWTTAFTSRLSIYRKLFEDYGGYTNWQNKSGC